jgi:IS30 family transposase
MREEVCQFGADLIIGSPGQSAIVPIVDRVSRFTLMVDLPGRHCATKVLAFCIELRETVPEELRRMLNRD